MLLISIAAAGGSSSFCSEIHFERFGPEHGLSHNTINDILQDRQGFLWLATDDGLSRYDGYEFRNFRPEPSPGASNVVTKLLEDSSGRLWVGTRAGLFRFEHGEGRFVAVELPGRGLEPSVREVRVLRQGPDGGVWVGSGARLFYSRPGTATFRQLPLGLPGSKPLEMLIWDLDWDPSGEPWVLLSGNEANLLVRVGPVENQKAGPVNLPRRLGSILRFDSGDGVWLGWPDPAWEAPPGWRIRHPEGILAQALASAFLETSGGILWIGTDEGLYRLRSGAETAERLLPEEGGSWQQNWISALLQDRSGALWVGTLGGLYLYDPNRHPFAHLGHDPRDPDGLRVGAVSAIVEERPGVLWVGTFGGGLHRIDWQTRRVESFHHQPGGAVPACSDVIWSLLLDSSGRLWIGTEDGLCSFDTERHHFLYAERPEKELTEGLPFWVRTLFESSPGRLWAGSDHGLFIFDVAQRRWMQHQGVDHVVSSLLVSSRQAWLGRVDGTLFLLDPVRRAVEQVALTDSKGRAVSDLEVFDLLLARAGRLWLATDGGLGLFDPDRRTFTFPIARDELPGSIVYSVLEDATGGLWLGTNAGLARLDPKGPPGSRVRSFDLGDGIGNMEFNRHAKLLSATGEMFFGGMSGLTGFRPEEIRANPYVPPLVLTRIQTLGKEGDQTLHPRGLDSLILDRHVYAITFEFAALSYTRPEKNRYAYKLEGFDTDWVDAGTRRFARYTSLPPGEYVFRLRGSNNDGVWNEEGLALPLTVLPPFWETWWFRLAVLASVVGLLTVLYRYRVGKLLELERIRVRIAGDLHDDLSSDLSGIALAMEMLEDKPGLEDPERRQVSQVRDRSLIMLDRLRDIVWYVNPEHDSLQATVRRMRSVAERLLAGKQYRFEASLAPESKGITLDCRRQLFLIYKEVLHNIARHSQAEHVEIDVSQKGGVLTLEIRDDGIGFDERATDVGHGLKSIRRRAQQIAAEVAIESAPGRGTRVRLRLPVGGRRDLLRRLSGSGAIGRGRSARWISRLARTRDGKGA